MKTFLMLGLLTLSAQAFSQTCYVDMVVKNSNRVVRSFTAYGDPSSCVEGMKECRKSIRFDYSNNPQYANGTLDCVAAGNYAPTPGPTPQPQPPRPTPQPPQPRPDYDYPTNIMMGETVFNVSNSRYAVVAGVDYQGKYLLRYTDNNATGGGWDRYDLAPLRGCDKDVCVNDQIFNVSNSRYAKVVALQTGGKFVLQYTDNSATGAGWDRYDLGVMKGCQSGYCVGSHVYNNSNRRYARIVALQNGNKFVLRYDDNGATGAGWDNYDLIVVQ